MTSISLHGALAKEFGTSFNFKIKTVKEAFDAIDANKPTFKSKLTKLSYQGMHYAVIVNGKKLKDVKNIEKKIKIKTISIVPAIMGFGPAAAAIAGALATAALGSALAAGAISMTTFIVASLVVGIVSMALQMLLAPKPPEPPAVEATTRALQDSFTFANKVNLADQGVRVPVGYGRLLSASNVIEFMTKNYPQNKEPLEFFKNGEGSFSSSGSKRRENPVEWPSQKPVDYRGWISSMSLNGGASMAYDPDTSHTGFVGGGWLPLSYASSVGSVYYEFGNSGTGTLKLYTYYGDGNHIPYGATLGVSTVGPGVTVKSFLGTFPQRYNTDWGMGEAIRRTSAAQGSLTRAYGAEGYQGYDSSVAGRGGGRTVFLFMIPDNESLDLTDLSNVVAKATIRISSSFAPYAWNNQIGASPPFFDPVYPNLACNGKNCHQNQTPDEDPNGCLANNGVGVYADPLKPCPAGGAGAIFKQNTNSGGVGPQVGFGTV